MNMSAGYKSLQSKYGMKVCLMADAQSIHTERLARGLTARGQSVHVLTHKPATISGVSVERFNVPPFGLQYPARWIRRRTMFLRNLLKKFDVINIYFLADWGFTEELLECGCAVASAWGSDVVPPPGEALPSEELLSARRVLLQHAKLVTAPSHSLIRETARLADLDPSSIVRAPWGVDLSIFDPSRFQSAARTRFPIIGFFKGFREVYGPTVLMRAIPKVLCDFPDAVFQLIGDGAQLVDCRKLAVELNIEKSLEWVPFQSHEHLPAMIARWDLSVVSSLRESFCVAALESQAMEIPVVASRIDGLMETVNDGKTGWLVPPGDPTALAEGIMTALRDRDRLVTVGAAGRQFVSDQFDWDRCVDHWVETYTLARDRALQFA